MQVKFLLWQSIVISFTLTALAERLRWKAKGKGEYLRGKWILKTGTSDYDDMGNGNVNSRKPRKYEAG